MTTQPEKSHEMSVREAARVRIHGMPDRFMSPDGRVTVGVDRLAVLVAEIVADYTDHLVAERDALAEDLAWDMNATRQEVA